MASRCEAEPSVLPPGETNEWPGGGHVGVVRLDNMGDVLLAGPAVRALSVNADRLTFVAGPAGAATARLLPGVDQVVELAAPWVPYEAPPFEKGPIVAFVDELSIDCPDQAVILTSEHQSPLPTALLLRMAGVRKVAGISIDHPGSLLDVRLRSFDGHEVERSLALSAACGSDLPPGDDGRLQLRNPLPDLPRVEGPYVVVHDGASVPARALPDGLCAALGSRAPLLGRRMVLTGPAGPPPVDSPADSVVDLRGLTTVPELAGVIERADAVVVGNTGPAHLAAAVGTPVVSIFAPVVSAGRWHPWMVPTVTLGDQQIACKGCRARTCPLPGQPCTAHIDAETVIGALRELVGATGTADAAPHGRAAVGAGR